MISYAWSSSLDEKDEADVANLLEESAQYDAEAGFSSARPDARGQGDVHHLVVTMPPRGERESPQLDALPDVRIVAYLRIDVYDGVGAAQFVVRPAFRSQGVGTLLFERLRDEKTGWAAVPGLAAVTTWAHGSHPAADRMRKRLGADVEDAVFKTIRLIGGRSAIDLPRLAGVTADDEGPVAQVAEGHDAALAPTDRRTRELVATAYRSAGTPGQLLVGLDHDKPEARPALLAIARDEAQDEQHLRALLCEGVMLAQDGGARVAQLYVDALDDVFVAATRLAGFEHDQSDLLYRLKL